MADNIRATPQNATLGAIANFLKQTYAPQRTQQMQGVMELLGVPALARTAERMSYGEPVTNINKANVPLLPADTAEAAMLAGPPLASLARRVGTNLVQTAPYVARDLAQSMTSPMRSYVVKPKGGNWLAGSVERAVEPLKRGEYENQAVRDLRRVRPELTVEQARDFIQAVPLAPEDAAMNRWLETKLGKYMRNEMATPEDPIRALAERGVMHYEPSPTGYSIAGPRVAAGFPEEGMGVSDLAKTWEGRADTFVNTLKASDMTGYYPKAVDENPWLLKVPPETPVYEMLSGAGDDLGFRHLADELRNAINPASGLPENLRLKYTDLEKVSLPQAVERVAKINEWRAGQKAEADLARAMGPATQVVKEYPEQGFKWVELRQPKETGKKVTVEKSEMELPDMDQRQMREVAEDMAFDEGFDEGTPEFNDFVRRSMEDFNRKKKVEMDESVKSLEDALKYEGETMGHCVGGYCPDVVEGRSRIYSLRDKKGQPHVTIEVAPKPLKTWRDVTAAVGPDESGKLYDEFDKIGGFNMDDTDAAFEMFIKNKGIKAPDDIVQIKGKANRAPNAEYLPAVQDFIKSGNWGRIGDAQNAGMRKFTDVFSSNELRMLQDAGAEFPNSGWLTGEDIQRLHNMITPEGRRLKYDPMGKIIGGEDGSGFSNGGAVRGYKAGGVVRSLEDLHQRYAEGGEVGGANFPTDDFDPARIDAIVGELHALNAG